MKPRRVVLGACAAVVLALPLAVWGRVEGGGGASAPPAFAGPSGRPVPAGGVEVVASGEGSRVAPASGPALGLAAGATVVPADGAAFEGPCECVSPSGVSFLVPAGAVARCRVGPDGSTAFVAEKGTIFARNREAVLYVEEGGEIRATADGRFAGLRGEGGVDLPGGRQGWLSWRHFGPREELEDYLRTRDMYQRVDTVAAPVSPFRSVR